MIPALHFGEEMTQRQSWEGDPTQPIGVELETSWSNRALLIGLLLFIFVGSLTAGGFLLGLAHGFIALAASSLIVAVLVALSE